MRITSQNFADGEKLDAKYTCDGQNTCPELSWSDFPGNTESFVLTCIDPDSPGGNFRHWLVINIPVDTAGVQEGSANINGGTGINNDFGQTEYGGPCPGMGEHRYVFSIYALDVAQINKVDKNNLQELIKPHILDQAQIIGLYQRK